MAREKRRLRSKRDGVFIRGILLQPAIDFIASEIVLATPDVNLHDAVADGFARVEGAASFVHGASGVKQTDVGEDGAEAVVGVGKIALQSESAFEFGDGFDMLKILRGSPKQESIGDMTLGKIGIEFE